MIRLLAAIIFVMLACGSSWASRELETKKVSPQVEAKARLGEAVDALVLLDARVESAAEVERANMRGARTETPDEYRQRMRERETRLNTLKNQIKADLIASDLDALRDYSVLPIMHIRIRSPQALERLLRHDKVLSIDENRLNQAFLNQSLPLVGQPTVWNGGVGLGGAGVAVAVLDTGVDYTRAAFGSCLVPGGACKVAYARDFAPNDGLRDDGSTHGTNVSGIVLGVAPAAKVIGLDVFNGASAYASDIIAAINWCVANKASYNIAAINMSLGGGRYSSPLTPSDSFGTAVQNAVSAGIVVVAASGNDEYTNSIAWPAAYSNIVSVGAVYDANVGTISYSGCTDMTTAADRVPCFSNSASFLTMLAPGALIDAAAIMMAGTSQAAPHVAGAAAVLRAAFPGDSVAQSVSRLKQGPLVLDNRNGVSKPRLNLITAANVDTSAPQIISGPEVSLVSSTSARITWSTDETSSSTVRYGTTAGNLTQSKVVVVMTTDHEVVLTDLLPGSTYYYVVESADSSNNTVTSAVGNFTTLSPNVAPVITQGAGALAVTMSRNGTPNPWSPPTLSATDADGDTLTWGLVADATPMHGVATVSGTGSSPSTFTYQPASDYVGSDSFSVQVSDGSLIDTIVVNVTITEDSSMMTTTVASTDVPKTIPDLATVYSTLNVPAGSCGNLLDVNVSLTAKHPWMGELAISLIHQPTGRAVSLVNRLCSSGDNINATFDDEAPGAVVCSGTPVISGTVYPQGTLSTFDGIDAAGEWRLSINDNASGDVGSLSAWSLNLTCPELTPLNDDTEFVRQVYRDFLNREADEAGLNYWVGELAAGNLTRAELVEQYLLSAEFGEKVAPVVRLYFTYFLRLPDYEGLMFWVNAFAAGMTLQQISDEFAASGEFDAMYGALSNEQFVSQMYQNVYGREPDAGGLAFWTGHLDAGNLTRGQVMVEFASAEEYLALSASDVYVTMTYIGLLRRVPDQGGFDYWVGVMDLGASGLALIDSFLGSGEYAARFAP